MRPVAQYGCQATGCQRLIARGHLMCNEHWRMVPAPLRREVWVAWRVLRRTPTIANSRSYLQAKQAAIDAVQAKQLGRLAAAEKSTPSLF